MKTFLRAVDVLAARRAARLKQHATASARLFIHKAGEALCVLDRKVLVDVGTRVHQLEILWAIIKLVAIDVMHAFMAKQPAPKTSGKHEPVFCDSPLLGGVRVFGASHVAITANYRDAALPRIAFGAGAPVHVLTTHVLHMAIV